MAQQVNARGTITYDVLDVQLEHTSAAVMASLRRTLVENSQAWAFDNVNFTSNACYERDDEIEIQLYKVVLSGSKPLRRDTVYWFSICVECDEKRDSFVYASHLKCEDSSDVQIATADDQVLARLKPKIFCPSGGTTRLELRARASWRNANHHAKYAPINLPTVKPLAHVSMRKKEMNRKEAERFVSVCEADVFKIRDPFGSSEHVIVDIEDMGRACTYCRRCTLEWGGHEIGVKVEKQANEHRIYIESYGARSTRQVLEEAFEDMDRRLDKLSS